MFLNNYILIMGPEKPFVHTNIPWLMLTHINQVSCEQVNVRNVGEFCQLCCQSEAPPANFFRRISAKILRISENFCQKFCVKFYPKKRVITTFATKKRVNATFATKKTRNCSINRFTTKKAPEPLSGKTLSNRNKFCEVETWFFYLTIHSTKCPQ